MIIQALEFPSHLEWFNTSHPLRLADQRGKIVLLDFWTYCCINCMHILPDLAYLEKKYADALVVIGIHSPKFPHERLGQQVQKAINRYHIHHPVAHDPLFTLWQHYRIRAWPSLLLIDSEGNLIGVLSGEGRRGQLDQLIAEHIQKAKDKNLLIQSDFPVQLTPEPELPLKFPGKLIATDQRLYISDSGHHRVLETNWDGKILRSFGKNGRAGFHDGTFEHARFNDPQGLTKIEERLYVADTRNHAIRCIDLSSNQVQTIAGTGKQGRYVGTYFEEPLDAPLNSPWDVVQHNGILYIAMSGQHQIWFMNLATRAIGVYAGSGREDILDGSPHATAFAQPSGLSLGHHALYVADSETSAIRSVQLRNVLTSTLVGRGLFEFGDQDGQGTQVRLQHPLGIAWDEQRQGIWIADTYNNKIKFLTVQTAQVTSLSLNHPLDEPGGISLYQDTLWIANTNAHQIVCYHIDTQECVPITIR